MDMDSGYLEMNSIHLEMKSIHLEIDSRHMDMEIEIESLLGLAVSLREVRRSASNHVDQMDLTGTITNMKFTSKLTLCKKNNMDTLQDKM